MCACQNPENFEAATAKSDVCAWAWSYFIVAAGRSGALTEDQVVHASFLGRKCAEQCMKILDFIEKDGEGKYSCYKTRKLILDQNDQDTLDYDDKPAVQLNSAQIAESDMSRKNTVLINSQMMKLAVTPLFSYFLDGSRHVYKVDDIAIGNRIFPFL